MPDVDRTINARITVVQASLIFAAALNFLAIYAAITDGPHGYLVAGVTVLLLVKLGDRRFVFGRKVIECAECGWQVLVSEPEARLAYDVHWSALHGHDVAVAGGPMANVPGTDRWVPAVPEPFIVRERGRADW